ncbi:50S ribosomal protein L13 [bacterium]|jgi:large subunit ribosomal protein L13|nr:50S ribosomal protein L13 [Gemmatimonadota bacterium]MCH2661517.1 50S ribosomal protein L13 [bacterium]|tara:strand:+ start:19 stop:453 length:435 start_codon:yes stop_codon:yes gene_type:complete
MSNTTYSPKPGDVERKWYVVDATDKVLGRLASEIAQILRGKRKPEYAPHADVGDHVIVINAEKIKVTGAKAENKVYHRHTGYAGGLRTTPYSRMIERHPDRVIRKAVQGMLPHTRLGRTQIKKLRVYAGAEHRHQAQSPELLDL